jgi:hypothetical protein
LQFDSLAIHQQVICQANLALNHPKERLTSHRLNLITAKMGGQRLLKIHQDDKKSYM